MDIITEIQDSLVKEIGIQKAIFDTVITRQTENKAKQLIADFTEIRDKNSELIGNLEEIKQNFQNVNIEELNRKINKKIGNEFKINK